MHDTRSSAQIEEARLKSRRLEKKLKVGKNYEFEHMPEGSPYYPIPSIGSGVYKGKSFLVGHQFYVNGRWTHIQPGTFLNLKEV